MSAPFKNNYFDKVLLASTCFTSTRFKIISINHCNLLKIKAYYCFKHVFTIIGKSIIFLGFLIPSRGRCDEELFESYGSLLSLNDYLTRFTIFFLNLAGWSIHQKNTMFTFPRPSPPPNTPLIYTHRCNLKNSSYFYYVNVTWLMKNV